MTISQSGAKTFRDIPVERLVLLIRHAESEKNVLNFHGHNQEKDYSLTAEGLDSATRLGRWLSQRIRLETIATSFSLAPTQTGQAIAAAHGIEVEQRKDLRAVYMGTISTLPDAEIIAKHPHLYEELSLYQKGLLHPRNMTIPGMEAFATFANRISEELLTLKQRQHPLAIVAHHSSLTMLLHVMRSPRANVLHRPYQRYQFPNLSCTLVESRSTGGADWEVRETAVAPETLYDAPAGDEQ